MHDEVRRTVAALDGPDIPWWIAGGWAIDLWLGRVTREHHDVDIAVLRRDQDALRRWLSDGWDASYLVQIPGGTRAEPWTPGVHLASPVHQVRAGRPDGSVLELLLNDADGDDWVYRRDPRVRLPLARLGAIRGGLPVLVPEVVLLYKASAPRPQDCADRVAVLPTMRRASRTWLTEAIATAHPASPLLR